MTQVETGALVTGPIAGGSRGWPFAASMLDLAALGYREDEYFLEGTATRYRHVPGTEPTRDGRWQAEPAESAPFKTRFLVVRPIDGARFNGTTIVIWNNVTAGYDLFNADSRELLENGFAIVAVTTQPVAINGLPEVPSGMASWDPERYGSLAIPGDDYSFDVYTQAARAVGPDRPRNPVDPMGGLEVQRLVAQGASQSAGRLSTYVNAIQPLTHAFDAFILSIYFGTSTALEVGDQVVNINDPERSRAPRNRLTGGNLLRDDVGVPVMVVNSELESISCHPVRQPDTELFRYWESAATCHTSYQGNIARRVQYRRDFGGERPIIEGMNRVPMNPLYDAAFHHMQRWLTEGVLPPSQPLIEFAGDPPEIGRDEHGIAKGGIRLPQAEAPIATNSAVPVADDIWSYLAGSCQPFSREKLIALYGNEAAFSAKFEAAAQAVVARGVLMPRDVEPLLTEAVEGFRAAT
jgi:hypothetical protein